jgi:hypothetical protein
MTQRPKKVLDQVRDAIRLKHCAYSTEKTYIHWAKRLVLYQNKRHLLEMGEKEISEFASLRQRQTHPSQGGPRVPSAGFQTSSLLVRNLMDGAPCRCGVSRRPLGCTGCQPTNVASRYGRVPHPWGPPEDDWRKRR